MKSLVKGSPSFAYIEVDLAPGESIISESDAMSSMSAELDLSARWNGGFFPAVARRFLGKESLFINEFRNNGQSEMRLTLAQKTPGDIRQLEMRGSTICLQPGAFIAATPGVSLSIRWGGLGLLFAGEGFFNVVVSGTGTLWYGAYGGLVDKAIQGEYVVDTHHLVAYDPQLKLRTQLASGLFSSFFGGEGLVTRIEGTGQIVMQTRSMSGLSGWLNPKL